MKSVRMVFLSKMQRMFVKSVQYIHADAGGACLRLDSLTCRGDIPLNTCQRKGGQLSLNIATKSDQEGI